MTNKEAIDCINAIHVQMFNDGNTKWTEACDMAIRALEQQKIGKWVCLRDQYDDIVDAVCSKCNAHGNDKWAFCPECGAKMEAKNADSN